jgi:hypothetical protein
MTQAAVANSADVARAWLIDLDFILDQYQRENDEDA